jgi:hypothetical protein
LIKFVLDAKVDSMPYILQQPNNPNKMDRVAVWEATKQHYSRFPPQDSQVTDDLNESRYAAATATATATVTATQKPYMDMKVSWHQTDCIDVAAALKKQGLSPLLLNMASDFVPGGGVHKGAPAQEEELFRRSNYHKFLHRRWYPFPTFRTIVSRGVEFYRASADAGYAVLPTPVQIDCVAVAGIRRPDVTADGRRFQRAEDAPHCASKTRTIGLKAEDCDTQYSAAAILLKKLRILFQVAADNGNDCLVLSALGCGAFRGPVQHIAEIFRQVVEENRGRFKEVSFAILGENYGKFRRAYSAA